ncbi:MAG: pyruvate dehydrogenase complex dihydrolipoamide acetyltransferase [Betaproteobacteria bacterium RIFCSPLOWO2_12_FULL_63_13]|nr:MAG: pyruvate dehydrogenase complex dihydrolipoamide acetyltransferase [Betaproteobacteria bacterium RIFCSPLOWO2_02_FULL_63_19]OGA43470.1 MAG: pyruvate dehydrogenase complex dihydrolipoamide acetyltransferase [Betaproteobacteria bacterium RIFCSPLOWO2_12_FULL_63_13]
MAIEILMPTVAPSMTEGNIVRWAKKEGDQVKQGEVLLEVETDKAVVEVEAQQEGVLGKILVAEGTNGVKVDTPIALLAGAGEDLKALSAATPIAAAAASSSAPAAASAPGIASAPVQPPGGRVFASPLARRIAKERNIDLARVSGSGPNGRVLKADVEAATAAAPASGAAYEDVAHSNTRRVIAQRLSEAKRSIPHFYLTIDCDVDALLDARRQANEMIDGVKLSVNDLVIKAVALALRKVPAANAAWTDSAIRRFRDVDVAVAVAAPSGLITPVVRNADRKSLREISAEMKGLAARAQENRLRPDEYQGGGFTVSNLGMYGIREFSAIINPPQACILAVGASEQRAVVRNGALAVATMMTCTLSVDHRAVDGALGAEFLAAFKKLIESPIALFL